MSEPLSSGVKNDGGKLRFDLLPVRPMEYVAEVFTLGAKTYADRNWEKGLKWSRVYGAALRHLFKWWRGERVDPDGQHHLASVVWCALALMEYEYTHPEMDDRPVGSAGFRNLGPSQRTAIVDRWGGKAGEAVLDQGANAVVDSTMEEGETDQARCTEKSMLICDPCGGLGKHVVNNVTFYCRYCKGVGRICPN